MALAPPRKTLPVRLLNQAGGVLRRAGLPLAPLDEEGLLERARRNTRLSDFGDDGFREPLRRLLASLEGEARLTWLGRQTARAGVTSTLETRLRLTEASKRQPSTLEGSIERPIFVLGMPRTGTSILHELLAQDPGNRVPLTWEVDVPCPPPERASYATDPRIEATDRKFGQIERIIPDFKRMHPMGALLPQECVALTALEFTTLIYHTQFDVPSYQAWLEEADLRPAYRSHRRQLLHLQWRCPGERWVLKSPGHLWALEALLDVYPDARIVQCHRDPLTVIASLTSLVATLRSMGTDVFAPHAIARDWTRRLAQGLQSTTEVRERRGLAEDRVLDIGFREFMADEIAMVRRVYSHFGLELSAAAEDRMRRFLAANPAGKHGAHTYSFADTGLDPEEERDRYAAYQQRFGVASEAG